MSYEIKSCLYTIYKMIAMSKCILAYQEFTLNTEVPEAQDHRNKLRPVSTLVYTLIT
jgi:hypothetical protein